MLLHSPIRDVYLCIQGFDSRLACRICNNTVQSSIRADGLSVDREKRRWREFDEERKGKRGLSEEEQERKKEAREKQVGEKERHRRQERGNCRETDSAEVFGMIPVSPEETNCNRELPVSGHSCCWTHEEVLKLYCVVYRHRSGCLCAYISLSTLVMSRADLLN